MCIDSADPLLHLLGHAAHLSRERMVARLSGYDMTPAQTHALVYLQQNGGQAPQRELTNLLRVKPSTANGILDRMEEKGLIVRTVSGKDARQKIVSLTAKGLEKQSFFQKQVESGDEIGLRGFAPEERDLLRQFLNRIIQNLEEDRNVC